MTRKTPKSKTPYRRPDTYRSAADLVGVSAPHVYQIVHGRRTTTAARRKALFAWARRNAEAGRGDAPAVAAALRSLRS